jgi:TfoX/Sxy family transcriptional regulator of competence genes
MAYDEELADRLRELLASQEGVSEKAMFGGLAFLVNGNMCVSASRTGGLLVRIDPAQTDNALARPHTALMEMGGRTMEGWLIVAPTGIRTKRELTSWVNRALGYVRTLPGKKESGRARRTGTKGGAVKQREAKRASKSR